MNRSRRWSVLSLVLFLVALTAGFAFGQAAAKEEKNDAEWTLDRVLTVSPRAEPIPAFKYRLFPMAPDRKEGNAVPIYLRFAHERNEETKNLLAKKTEEWSQLPLAELPRAEVRELLGHWKYNLKQLELGAQRKTADWNYTLDAGNVIGLLLPDMQEMRLQVRILAVKARLEIAEGHFDEALHTLQTGFSFSQQLSEGPFLICGLVGVAGATTFMACQLELVEQPGAPNLYWALTNLPRPFIDLRRAIDFEHRVPELQFPDLADVERERTPAQWEAALRRIRVEIDKLGGLELEPGKGPKKPAKSNVDTDPAKSPDLPAARKYLTERAGIAADVVEAMPAAQVLVLYVARCTREIYDNYFKMAYLPYPQARVFGKEIIQQTKAGPRTEGTWIGRMLVPALDRVNYAQDRLQRKIDAQRIIEALRLHAAAHGGELPDHLSDIKVVPVPNDPGTDRPFEYHRDGNTATLISRIPDEQARITALRYRVTIRK
jgi:hypothetical protein